MKARYVEYGGKLAAFCLVCIFGVAFAYVGARERIQKGKDAVFETAIRAVLGTEEAPEIVNVRGGAAIPDEEKVFTATVTGERRFAAQGEQQGYSSVVEVAVGAKLEEGRLIVRDVRVIAQAETPGLGTRIAEQETSLTLWSKIGGLMGAGAAEETDWYFLKRYRGKTADQLVLTGDPAEADDRILRITGVTISSSACTVACRNALAKILAALEEKGERIR